VNKREIVRSIQNERLRTLTFLQGLEPAQWDTPTALPGWRIREVLAHLITTDRAAITGKILPQVFGSMDKLEAWNDRQLAGWKDQPTEELLEALEKWGRRFATFARAFPQALYGIKLPSMLGKGEAGMLIWVRAYDEWIHRQDMRRALGMRDEEVDLDSVAEFLLRAIGFSTSPNVEGPWVRVAISLNDVPVPEWGYELGTRTNGPELADGAVARIIAPGPAFVMAAADRDRFDDLEQQGVLKIEGDEEAAHRMLSKLRIV
jgi:uncharacterized protein (TIGR03083 family)